jgi:Lrp/AsnC family leucine-responsive transcriptional regulator
MLNKVDRNILQVLQSDGRISFTELGKKVGLTTTPCIERVRKLEREGYIEGYSAVLNSQKLELGLIVFVQLRLNRTHKQTFEEFRRVVKNLPQVQECYLVTGNFDFLVKARVRDMTAYRDFLESSLLNLPGVQESTSIAVMETVKETHSLAVPGH